MSQIIYTKYLHRKKRKVKTDTAPKESMGV
jgi:hypothetical protein